MSQHPPGIVKVTAIHPCGDNKVCITMELVVDVHHLADVSSEMLSVAAKGVAKKKKSASADSQPHAGQQKNR